MEHHLLLCTLFCKNRQHPQWALLVGGVGVSDWLSKGLRFEPQLRSISQKLAGLRLLFVVHKRYTTSVCAMAVSCPALELFHCLLLWKTVLFEFFHCLPTLFYCLSLWKTVLFVSSRAFSLSTSTFLLSTPVENSEATWKKATKCNKGLWWPAG